MILEVESLSKTFPGRRAGAHTVTEAVREVSFQIAEGETLGLLGESGCGKTTLARCILGLYEPDGGEIRFRGTALSHLSRSQQREVKRDIQGIFQDPFLSLNPRLRISTIVEEALVIHRMGDSTWRRQRVAEMLSAVGLEPEDANRYPESFSGGQRQRIAIARALAPEPGLLIADEPLSALDRPIKSRILALLRSLRAKINLSILFISHEIELISQFSDRVAVMYQGRLVELASTPEFLSQPRHPYTRFLLSTHERVSTSASGAIPAELLRPGCFDHLLGDLRQITGTHWVAGPS